MLSNIYLLQFNNYFNRKIKKLGTLEEYTGQAVFTLANTSFNPNDGINTSHVFNTSIACDYAVVTDVDGGNMTRWFVIENKRNRAGQYTMLFRRDLVADYYDSILDSPCYIEKATVSASDPAIFNKEGAGYNQIKKSETLLKDELKTKWLVAFISKQREQDYTFTATLNNGYQITATSKDAWKYAEFIGEGKYSNITNIIATIRTTDGNYNKIYSGSYTTAKFFGNITKQVFTWDNDSYAITQRGSAYGKVDDSLLTSIYETVGATTYLTDYGYDTTIPIYYLDNLNGKVIKFTDSNTLYKITVNKKQVSETKGVLVNSDLYLKLKEAVLSHSVFEWTSSREADTFSYTTIGTKLSLTLTKIDESTNITYTLPKTTTTKGLKDQPFDIIMCPYELDTGVVVEGGKPSYGVISTTDSTLYKAYHYNNDCALNIMSQIASNTSLCYDLQILPYYIPGDAISSGYGSDDLRINDTTKCDILGSQSDSIFIWYPSTCSFRNTILLDKPAYITEPKIQNECDLYRFVAPNYGSAFDFNIVMNGGLFSVEINCTYLPYQSYIHVNPTFGELYGSDFNDQRGLVCGGNYSISAVSDAWKEYVTNNKNYADIFDREIQNMEVNRSVQKVQEIGNAITGTVTGVMRGAITGANVGGGVGAGVGAVVGGVASAVGGVVDVAMSQKLYDESKSYKYDMQKYSLGNIQALPNSLARTSAYNVDNKYYPFIEYYTCTDEEKEALRNQIKYTGMTVRRVGKLRDYLQPDYSYVQGKMIMIDGLNDDYELLKAISEEIMQGVYLK